MPLKDWRRSFHRRRPSPRPLWGQSLLPSAHCSFRALPWTPPATPASPLPPFLPPWAQWWRCIPLGYLRSAPCGACRLLPPLPLLAKAQLVEPLRYLPPSAAPQPLRQTRLRTAGCVTAAAATAAEAAEGAGSMRGALPERALLACKRPLQGAASSPAAEASSMVKMFAMRNCQDSCCSGSMN